MSIVKVKIINRDYQLACNDGAEQKLLDLVGKLDDRIQDNARKFKGANEAMLMLLTSIMLEDKLQDFQRQNQALQDRLDNMANEISSQIDKLANKIEML